MSIEKLQIKGNTSAAVLDINGAPQFSIFNDLTVINTGDGGHGIHIRNESYVSQFSNIHCSAQGTLGSEVGFFSEDGGLNVYSNITSTDCYSGTAIVFGNPATGGFGLASVISAIQARNSNRGMNICGASSVTVAGVWIEKNDGDYDLRIANGTYGITLDNIYLTSTDLKKASALFGDNTGDSSVDECSRILLRNPRFGFVGPDNDTYGFIKYSACRDIEMVNPSFKNNGGKGGAIEEGVIGKCALINPDWFPSNATSEITTPRRIVSLSTGNDARYLAQVEGESIVLSAPLSIFPTDFVDNGSGAIRVVATGHGLSTGDLVYIRDVSGTTEANGDWEITVVDANNFDLQGSTFSNAYTSGGRVTKYLLDMRTWEYLPDRLALDSIDGDACVALPTAPFATSASAIFRKRFAGKNARIYVQGGDVGGTEAVNFTAAGLFVIKHYAGGDYLVTAP